MRLALLAAGFSLFRTAHARSCVGLRLVSSVKNPERSTNGYAHATDQFFSRLQRAENLGEINPLRSAITVAQCRELHVRPD